MSMFPKTTEAIRQLVINWKRLRAVILIGKAVETDTAYAIEHMRELVDHWDRCLTKRREIA